MKRREHMTRRFDSTPPSTPTHPPAAQPAARPPDGRHYVPEWKHEEARQKNEAAARQQKSPEQHTHYVFQVTDIGDKGSSEEQLKRLWEQFQAGNNQALFDLIIWQLSRGKPSAPEAAITEFIARYDRWRLGEVRTLDEAFGVQRRKGEHLRMRRRGGNRSGQRASREQYRGLIVARIYELRRDEDLSIDKGAFERVAEELGLHPATVEEIYGEPASQSLRKVAPTGRLRVTSRKQD